MGGNDGGPRWRHDGEDEGVMGGSRWIGEAEEGEL